MLLPLPVLFAVVRGQYFKRPLREVWDGREVPVKADTEVVHPLEKRHGVAAVLGPS